jgi:septum formation topological specificity factor MinE
MVTTKWIIDVADILVIHEYVEVEIDEAEVEVQEGGHMDVDQEVKVQIDIAQNVVDLEKEEDQLLHHLHL